MPHSTHYSHFITGLMTQPTVSDSSHPDSSQYHQGRLTMLQ